MWHTWEGGGDGMPVCTHTHTRSADISFLFVMGALCSVADRFQSERESGDRNFAIGYYLKEKKVWPETSLCSCQEDRVTTGSPVILSVIFDFITFVLSFVISSILSGLQRFLIWNSTEADECLSVCFPAVFPRGDGHDGHIGLLLSSEWSAGFFFCLLVFLEELYYRNFLS